MIKILINTLAVAAGGAVGTLCRYALGTLFDHFIPEFPAGTLVINVTGCFIIGCFKSLASQRMIPEALALSVAVGFVGGYTTFSTYMWESNKLLESGSTLKALTNIFGSVALGLIAVKVGIVVSNRILVGYWR